jgi:hypothetical protein
MTKNNRFFGSDLVIVTVENFFPLGPYLRGDAHLQIFVLYIDLQKNPVNEMVSIYHQ